MALMNYSLLSQIISQELFISLMNCCLVIHQVILCFSPVGNTLRIRSRNFPALTNCTNIDWFHEWPEEALISVSQRFLSEVELLTVSTTLSHSIKLCTT